MMNPKEIRIVFMGTPEFAVPSLRALVAGGYNVVGVVTAPDKPAGRGQKLHQSEVKTAALELGLPVLQPEKLKAPEFVEAMQALRPDLGIVIAFRMLPEVIWAMPRLGTFNLHASLLPQYRGAAPINWAIINGETETGVTTFLLNHEIDKGGIIGQVRVPILPEDNVGTLYDKLMTTGTALVTSTVDRIAAGDIRPVEQQHIDESTLRPAPKIFKEDCRIDWTLPGRRIADFIRGLSPYPAAWTEMFREEDEEPQSAKVFSATFEAAAHGQPCGTVESDGRTFIRVACADGWIVPGELQIAGKKRLAVRDLLLVLATVSVLVLLITLIARGTTDPIRTISNAASEIARGNYDVQVSLRQDRVEEYGELQRNFNAMARELKKNEYLRQDFISNVSHELKTPLAIIEGILTMLVVMGLETYAKTELNELQTAKGGLFR